MAVTSAWLLCVCVCGAADPPPFLEGYADPMSVSPGEEVRFHVSTNAEQYSLEIARLGATDEIVWTRQRLPGGEHPVGDDSGRPAYGAMYGNTCCWQVRVEDDGRALVCYKRAHEQDPVFGTEQQHRLTTLWSDPLLKRPENLLSGVGFTYGGYNGFFDVYESGPGEGEYTVHRPAHWVFACTGLKPGEKFGKQASIAGYESDGCEYVFDGGLPVPTGRDGTPKNLQILATAPGYWAGGDSSIEWAKELRKALPPGDRVPENFVDREGGAVLGIHTQGGTVVTAGSCDWSYGLQARDPVVERITGNILDRLSR